MAEVVLNLTVQESIEQPLPSREEILPKWSFGKFVLSENQASNITHPIYQNKRGRPDSRWVEKKGCSNANQGSQKVSQPPPQILCEVFALNRHLAGKPNRDS